MILHTNQCARRISHGEQHAATACRRRGVLSNTSYLSGDKWQLSGTKGSPFPQWRKFGQNAQILLLAAAFPAKISTEGAESVEDLAPTIALNALPLLSCELCTIGPNFVTSDICS
jgi:hypothetical protein